MSWQEARRLRADKFRRLVGVSPPVCEQIREAAQASEPASTHPVQGAKRGPKPRLALEDRLLMLLMYYREYRTFAHTGASFGVSETPCWRIVTDLEVRLLADARFHLARKQARRGDTRWRGVVVVDVGGRACIPAFPSTPTPATRVSKSSTPTRQPTKATKKRPLTPEQKRANRQINSERVLVEHAIRRLKVFRLLGERYRNRRRRFGLRLNLIAAPTNLK